jgi:hypothetical protein
MFESKAYRPLPPPDSAGGNPRGTERTPLLDLNGLGVTVEEITRWKAAGKRFGHVGTDMLNFYSFPRSDRVIEFFKGESDVRDGKQNLVSNPLRLQKPETLLSIESFFEKNNQPLGQLPKMHAKTYGERPSDDNTNEGRYIRAIKAFDGFATSVVVSLNESDPDKRRGTVKKELDKAFGAGQEYRFTSPYDVRKDSAVENPAEWLVYSVISVLDNPSERITPVGRMRALELLQLFSSKELSEGFRSERYNNKYSNGYDKTHIQRLPYTFCTREERLQKDHKNIWGHNERIQQLLIKDANRRIDWRATANALAERAPEEAIQVALLLLHSDDTTEGSLAFLSKVPTLEPEVKSKMLGKKATFLIEHDIAKRGIDAVIAEGLGTIDVAGNDLGEEIAGKSKEELMQELRRARVRAEGLEDSLVEADSRAAKRSWENMALKEENERLKNELNKRSRFFRQPEAASATNMVDKLDPNGYYRILGLELDAFEKNNEEEIQKKLKKRYTFFSLEYHPDKGGDTEKMQKLIEAYNVMKDPNQRNSYGQRR